MANYDHKTIEPHWQKYWQDNKIFTTSDDHNKKKYYVLDMFPYPSSAGLHVGHPEGYTASDIVARYRKMKYNENILHPMGFDAFGLPAENYAIKMGRHPREITEENIQNFIKQLRSLGFSYDWNRQVVTSRPEYYRFTQWMFRELYQKGLAYKKKAPVNWCESCKTVLAREQVIDGKCERCKNQVVQKELEQWFFKVTAYADELLNDLEKLDWPEPIKALQRNWIGRSEGAIIKFPISLPRRQAGNFQFPNNSQTSNSNASEYLEVFTTRPDTLFGVTYMVVAPEHSLIQNAKIKIQNWELVEEYINNAQKKNELERTDLAKEKTGVELKGIKAINPASGEEIPIFVADYVLMGYGTGAIMAVPAHDERDFEFAKKYNLPIKQVVEQDTKSKKQETNRSLLNNCFADDGIAINSGEFNGLTTQEFKQKITAWLEQKELGKKAVNYKLRDWLVSRQRYWGAPIPIIYCEKCGEVLVPEQDLPVLLPDDVDFRPTGESPLARSQEFKQNLKCPVCGAAKGIKREVDTMDTFVCSSWYFLRYADPHNNEKPFDQDKVKYWLPVDLYVGGAEHAVLHLMYARFFTKALADMGYIDFREPFLKLRNQGMILAEDGRKMSKSLGNVINPDEVVEQYGADTLRLYEMFMGPLEDTKPWSTKSIVGVRRMLEKTLGLYEKTTEIKIESEDDMTRGKIQRKDLVKQLHKTIKKVTDDIEGMKFNTAIAQLMILINKMEEWNYLLSRDIYEKFILLLSPFAPHLAEEIWRQLGHQQSIALENWPEYDPALIQDEEIELVVQINGKVRDKIAAAADIAEEEARKLVLQSEKVQKWLNGQTPKKVIFIKGKLVNIVV